MRIPTFSRHSSTDTADDERPTMVTGTPAGQRTVAPPSDETTMRWFDNSRTNEATNDNMDQRASADRVATERAAAAARADRDAANRDSDATTAELRPRDMSDLVERRRDSARTDEMPAVTGPKPRASLLATLGLIGGVASALLVLSGPLLPYGIGLAVLALILSVSGMHATGRRHVAGKTDALIGMVLSLAAIVIGVLALTGSLSWLGTDTQPVTTLRQWLDAQTVNRF
ncbi:MAG TPA: Yip1 family protein [Actinoplanes sp.]